MIKKIKNKFSRKKQEDSTFSNGIPRITNETLAETRQEVLKGARKFVYPLQHSKHRVVILSSFIGFVSIVLFFTFTMLSLYRYNATSTLIYRVTQIIPFPVAKIGGTFIPYEDYLFEIRQTIHYFENKENMDFSLPENKQQLDGQRKEALDRTIKRHYIRKLAKANSVKVSDDEINKEISIYQAQNKLGGDERILRDVLQNFYGLTINDFRRQLADKILAEKVIDVLDKDVRKKAENSLAELKSGSDFAAVANKYSEDNDTKGKGGEIPFLIDKQDRNVPSQITSALYSLKPGEYSNIVSVGYGLVIVKNLEFKDDKVRAAQILFNYTNIESFINAEKEKSPTTLYLNLK